MKATFLRRIPLYLALLVFCLPRAARPAGAQQPSGQQDSVADAARRSREQKKKSQKPEKILTEDDLKPKLTAATGGATADTENAIAPASAQGEAAAPQAAPAPAAKAASPEDAAAAVRAKSELTKLKQELEQAQKDLDLAQREFTLDREQYYSNPDHARDTAGKAKLDNLEAQIRGKQQEVESLKTKVASQQEVLNRLKGASPAPGTRTKPPAT